MTFDEYQQLAKETKNYSDQWKIIYPCLGLAGESGEAIEKIKKSIRDNNFVIDDKIKLAVKKELGDTLWNIAMLADDLDINFLDVAITNINKLQDRQLRGVIGGSGDNR